MDKPEAMPPKRDHEFQAQLPLSYACLRRYGRSVWWRGGSVAPLAIAVQRSLIPLGPLPAYSVEELRFELKLLPM